MKTLKLAATLLSTLMLAVIGATSAEAANPSPTHHTYVTGFEFQASSTKGSFAGTASGQGVDGLSGAWSIVVYHTPLGSDRCGDPPYPCAHITSNPTQQSSFMLTVVSPSPAVVTGTFVNQETTDPPGIVQVGADTTCGTQHYHISDGLEGIGPVGSQHSGSGSFDADLWHYRYWFFGRCITYSAIVKGTVALTY